MKQKLIAVSLLIMAFLALAYSFLQIFYKEGGQSKIDIGKSVDDSMYEIMVENLAIPWDIQFLPDGRLIATERPGNLVIIGANKRVIDVKGVHHIGEGGLLGVALHPRFEENSMVYLYLTTRENGKISNRIEKYKLENNELVQREVIIDNIPGAAYHDGGKIAFGPDKMLYITTGDAGNSQLSKDINSPAGKILRIEEDGDIPADNPFNNTVYSYGHRNPQGLTWDNEGRLWATEHGRSGIKSGMDEINLIKKGKNYGWPIIEGDEKAEGMENPIIHSGPDETWAPAGAAFHNGRILFGGLRGQSLYEYDIFSGSMKMHFKGDFGRIRAVAIKDGFLYFSTSNRDGRGSASEHDDKIIRIDLSKLGG